MEELGQLVAGFEGFVRHYGAIAVMPILAIEAVGAPVPGESLLIFASVLAGRGEMSLSALLAFAWAGSVIGDNAGFLIGRKLGRGTVLRYGAKVGLTDERFSRIESRYIRYGYATVLFARFFSVLRQLNGVMVAFRVVRCRWSSALGHGLGVRPGLFQRAPDRHHHDGASY
jgi:membrane protein DedA with SNARE-associated domain